MHELSIANNLVDMALEAVLPLRVKKVISLRIRLGTVSCISASALQFCYDVVVRGTPLEGASLLIDEIRPKALCPHCQKDCAAEGQPPPFWCTVCSLFVPGDGSGSELELTAIEILENDRVTE